MRSLLLLVLLLASNIFLCGKGQVIYPTDALESNVQNIFGLQPNAIPLPRVKHTLVYTNPYVIVMGGYSTDGSYLDETILYHVEERAWSSVLNKRTCCDYKGDVIELLGLSADDSSSGSDSGRSITKPGMQAGMQGDIPLPRAEHAACAYEGKMYIFGGVTSQYSYSNDFYSFDPIALHWKVWDKYAGGGAPTRRAGHNLLAYSPSSSLYLFGGRSTIGGTTVGLSDVWVFDINTQTWTCVTQALSVFPAGRHYSAAAVSNGVLVIVGGMDPASSVIYNDVWAFAMGMKTWQQLLPCTGTTMGFAPPPLFHSSLFVLPTPTSNVNATGFETMTLILYGGMGGGGSCGGSACGGHTETTLGQAYKLSINQGTLKTAPQGSTPQNSDSQYFSSGLKWSFARLSTDVSTYAGKNHGRLAKTYAVESVAFDPVRSVLYEFGGLQARSVALAKGNQRAVEASGPTQLDSGEQFATPLWDLSTGEQLRTTMQMYTNGPWLFTDAFQSNQPQINGSIRFLQSFRTYLVSSAGDLLLQVEDNEGSV